MAGVILDRVTRRFDDALLREAQRASDAAEFAYSRGAIGVMDLLDARRQTSTRWGMAGAVSHP